MCLKSVKLEWQNNIFKYFQKWLVNAWDIDYIDSLAWLAVVIIICSISLQKCLVAYKYSIQDVLVCGWSNMLIIDIVETTISNIEYEIANCLNVFRQSSDFIVTRLWSEVVNWMTLVNCVIKSLCEYNLLPVKKAWRWIQDANKERKK